MSGKIHIRTILDKIDVLIDESTGQVRTFGIRYLKKPDQSGQPVGEILRARKAVKNPKAELTTSRSDPKGKFFVRK